MIRKVRIMKTLKRHKKAIIIITIILFCIGYVLNWFAGGRMRIGNSTTKYFYGGFADLIAPFAERGNPQKEFNYFYQDNMIIFSSISSVVIADYSENDYKAQKEFLESRERIEKRIGENWSNEPFSIHSWVFIVDGESEPTQMLTIFGFNEKKHKIAYIKFSAIDLHTISETPQEFFYKHIKYVFI